MFYSKKVSDENVVFIKHRCPYYVNHMFNDQKKFSITSLKVLKIEFGIIRPEKVGLTIQDQLTLITNL